MNIVKFNPAFFYDVKNSWVFDNKITLDKRIEVEWVNFVEWIRDCVENECEHNQHKNAQHMFNACVYRQCEDHEDFVYKREVNVVETDALILDYDCGYTIDEFQQRYRKIEWCLYTSYSHSTEIEKFRVIIPLTIPIPKDEMSARVRHLKKFFSPVDVSTFDCSRAFFIPGCKTENVKDARFVHNKGMLLDWSCFDVEEVEVFEPPAVTFSGKSGAEHDGKILWETINAVAMFKELQLYDASAGGGKHDVQCPWGDAHSGSPRSGTAIWQDGVHRAQFNCYHQNSHGKKSMYDVTKWVIEKCGIDFIKQFCEVKPYSEDQIERIKQADDNVRKEQSKLEQLRKQLLGE